MSPPHRRRRRRRRRERPTLRSPVSHAFPPKTGARERRRPESPRSRAYFSLDSRRPPPRFSRADGYRVRIPAAFREVNARKLAFHRVLRSTSFCSSVSSSPRAENNRDRRLRKVRRMRFYLFIFFFNRTSCRQSVECCVTFLNILWTLLLRERHLTRTYRLSMTITGNLAKLRYLQLKSMWFRLWVRVGTRITKFKEENIFSEAVRSFFLKNRRYCFLYFFIFFLIAVTILYSNFKEKKKLRTALGNILLIKLYHLCLDSNFNVYAII